MSYASCDCWFDLLIPSRHSPGHISPANWITVTQYLRYPNGLIKCVQSGQNMAARLVALYQRCDQTMPDLASLLVVELQAGHFGWHGSLLLG
jgi:hypothetical protein